MATEFSNGTTIPHADGWDDLLDKFETFITTDSTLVADSEEWIVNADTTVSDERFMYLEGPGLSATDEIHVNIRRYSELSTGAYNWEIVAATGYDSGLSFDNQPGISSKQYFCLANTGTTIQYWFHANGRRFMIVAKVATTYLSCYCGFYLPYATPTELPYPIVIMCGGEEEDSVYNEGTEEVTGFFNPKTVSGVTSIGSNSIRLRDGTWIRALNETGDSVYRAAKVWPNDDNSTPSYNIGTNDDDSYTILPFVLYSNRDEGDILGELDGVFWISGRDNLAENDLTISGDSYVCHQSANQSNIDEFAAFKIE